MSDPEIWQRVRHLIEQAGREGIPSHLIPEAVACFRSFDTAKELAHLSAKIDAQNDLLSDKLHALAVQVGKCNELLLWFRGVIEEERQKEEAAKSGSP